MSRNETNIQRGYAGSKQPKQPKLLLVKEYWIPTKHNSMLGIYDNSENSMTKREYKMVDVSPQNIYRNEAVAALVEISTNNFC